MSLKTSKQENFYEVQLNAEHFGETISYYPAGGGAPRAIVARVRHRQLEEKDGVATFEDERILVTLSRDEAHAKGGVAAPDVDDKLLREGDTEPAQRFGYTGTIVHSTPYSLTLEFARPKTTAVGGPKVRRQLK